MIVLATWKFLLFAVDTNGKESEDDSMMSEVIVMITILMPMTSLIIIKKCFMFIT